MAAAAAYPVEGPPGLPARNPKNRTMDRRPWTGTISLATSSSLGPTTTQRIHCVASDTHGQCRGDLWNRDFNLTISHKRGVLTEFLAWANSTEPYLSTIMPLTLPDPDKNKTNDSAFRSLSRLLSANQTVAFAKWDRADVPGAGILLYPLKASSCIIGGAIFLVSPFPDCITARPTAPVMPIRSQTPTPQILRQHHYQQQYAQPMPPSLRSQTPMPSSSRSQTPMPSSSRGHSYSHSHSQSASFSSKGNASYHYDYQTAQQQQQQQQQQPQYAAQGYSGQGYSGQGYASSSASPVSPLSPFSTTYPSSATSYSGMSSPTSSSSGSWGQPDASNQQNNFNYQQYGAPNPSYPQPGHYGYPTR